MALGKITKQILLIVSALVLATATTVCIVKRDSIANFFKSKRVKNKKMHYYVDTFVFLHSVILDSRI